MYLWQPNPITENNRGLKQDGFKLRMSSFDASSLRIIRHPQIAKTDKNKRFIIQITLIPQRLRPQLNLIRHAFDTGKGDQAHNRPLNLYWWRSAALLDGPPENPHLTQGFQRLQLHQWCERCWDTPSRQQQRLVMDECATECWHQRESWSDTPAFRVSLLDTKQPGRRGLDLQ